jgi:hypothetical protein
MNKQRYLDSELHKFCKSFSCNTTQFSWDDCNSSSDHGGNRLAEDRESWLGMLHLVTLKHSKNYDFSICDEIFEPLELIHIAYLLSAPDFISIPAKSAGTINLQSITQSKLKPKIAQYDKDASYLLPDEDTHEVKGVTDDGSDIPTGIQLQIIARQIFLRFPESAYDALLVLNEMQRESRRTQKSESERTSMRTDKGGGSFLEICVSVGHSLSLCDICSDTSDRFRDSKDHFTAIHGREVATHGMIQVLDKDQRCYRTVLQDSLLKVFLEAEDVIGVAMLLCRWSRFEDLRVFTDRVWGSVQFILGEHEQKEEYYSSPMSSNFSDAARRTVRVRRPVPLFESILELAHLDHPDCFSGHSEEESLGEGELEASIGKAQSTKNDCQMNLITEENKSGNPSASSSSKNDTTATPSLVPKCRALPANSNQLLRMRLLQFAAIQQLTADVAVLS